MLKAETQFLDNIFLLIVNSNANVSLFLVQLQIDKFEN
jgi:hypothetical protein